MTKRPCASVVAMPLAAPSADTIAPASGPPRLSMTLPWMLPSDRRACCSWAAGAIRVWADAVAVVEKTIPATESILLSRASLAIRLLLGRHREVDVLRQDLAA